MLKTKGIIFITIERPNKLKKPNVPNEKKDITIIKENIFELILCVFKYIDKF